MHIMTWIHFDSMLRTSVFENNGLSNKPNNNRVYPRLQYITQQEYLVARTRSTMNPDRRGLHCVKSPKYRT